MTPAGLVVDAGLLARFRDAGRALVWKAAPAAARARPARRVRRVHLHDDDATVATWGRGGSTGLAADAGPLGALVLLLEVDRRGPPTKLASWNAGADPAFPQGAVVALWGGGTVPTDATPTIADLVDLARYALP